MLLRHEGGITLLELFLTSVSFGRNACLFLLAENVSAATATGQFGW